ncbi:hypothetical protein Q8A67_002169 [Cirrhinus molitorella]|uniref:Uncharacterized protein n=1 Tax=Cirrhinus molitorella TaxID=172907 RepID=A0AA88QCB8_9TELE|nr:hypothetical protein Q8A67_002169 [Cirrhinus molitorella]
MKRCSQQNVWNAVVGSPLFELCWVNMSIIHSSHRLGSVNSVNREGIYSKEAGQDRSLLCIERLRACNETAVNKLTALKICSASELHTSQIYGAESVIPRLTGWWRCL